MLPIYGQVWWKFAVINHIRIVYHQIHITISIHSWIFNHHPLILEEMASFEYWLDKLYLLSDKTSCRHISWSLQAARLYVIMVISISSGAAEVSVNHQSHWKSSNPNLAASRLRQILREDVRLVTPMRLVIIWVNGDSWVLIIYTICVLI